MIDPLEELKTLDQDSFKIRDIITPKLPKRAADLARKKV
jgi:hypothetical protein